MMTLPTTVKGLFVPPTPEKLNFRTAVEAHQNQRIARITKIALFAIATLAASITLLLTEAAVVAWSITLPAIAITVAFSLLFYRLNAVDHRHIEHVEDEKKGEIVQKRLVKLFKEPTVRSDAYVRESLRGLNKLFGKTLFDETFIGKIIFLNTLKAESLEEVSLAELAKRENINLSIHFEDEWQEPGRFGLPGYQWGLKFIWDGQEESEIEVACKRALLSAKNE